MKDQRFDVFLLNLFVDGRRGLMMPDKLCKFFKNCCDNHDVCTFVKVGRMIEPETRCAGKIFECELEDL